MSNKRLYVGNLPFDATREDIRAAFEAYGTVYEVSLVEDRETGRPRGFGFVEMDEQGAKAAIEGLDSKDFQGRDLKVNEARERRGGRR
ncbi:MAG: RNA-binding protein [Candidatus Latescibacterota bacterium]|nr:MAG: RNA-binding protein [Candidatus Latescibacterota bacterium]